MQEPEDCDPIEDAPSHSEPINLLSTKASPVEVAERKKMRDSSPPVSGKVGYGKRELTLPRLKVSQNSFL